MKNPGKAILAVWLLAAAVWLYTASPIWKNLLTVPELAFLVAFTFLALTTCWNIFSAVGAMMGRILFRRWKTGSANILALAIPMGFAIGVEFYYIASKSFIPPLPFSSPLKIASFVIIFFFSWAVALTISILLERRKSRPATARSRQRTFFPVAGAALFCLMFYFLFIVRGWSFHLFSPGNTTVESTGENMPNLVMVTIDTLSAEYSGLYGYPLENTPGLERIANEGAVFKNAITTFPITGPSHASIMTGNYPRTLHLVTNFSGPMKDEFTTLAEVLKSKGYNTAQFVNIALCGAHYGLHSGFNVSYLYNYNQSPVQMMLNEIPLFSLAFNFWEKIQSRRFNIIERDENYGVMKQWIKTQLEPPFFLWFHTYIPHNPYEPPAYAVQRLGLDVKRGFTRSEKFDIFRDKKQLSPGRVAEIRDAYVSEILHADNVVSWMLDDLRNAGVLDSSFLVITADHGEEIYERDFYVGHAFYLNNAITHVPLVMRYPGKIKPGTVVKPVTSLVDLFPTVLDLMGIDIPQEIDGRSLAYLLMDPGSQPVRKEAINETFAFPPHHKLSIRRNGWHYIFHMDEEEGEQLYYVPADPYERNNLIGDTSHRDTIRELRSILTQWHKDHPLYRSRDDIHSDQEFINRMKELGYLQ